MSLALARVVDRRPWWRRALARLLRGCTAAARPTCAICGAAADGDGCFSCGVREAVRQYIEALKRWEHDGRASGVPLPLPGPGEPGHD